MLRGSLSHMVIYQRYIQTSMVSVITLSGSGLQYNTPGMLMDKGSRSDIRAVWGHLLAIIQPLIFTCRPYAVSTALKWCYEHDIVNH